VAQDELSRGPGRRFYEELNNLLWWSAITRQAETSDVCFPMRLVGFFKSIELE
jgi:hypothetical protein